MPDLLDSANPSGGDRALESPERPSMQVTPSARSEAPLLHFQHVSKWYGPVIGVNQVTLELRPGITGLVGANGAGKSTLLRLATGQLRPDLGRVRVFGIDSWTASAKRCVGYWPQAE